MKTLERHNINTTFTIFFFFCTNSVIFRQIKAKQAIWSWMKPSDEDQRADILQSTQATIVKTIQESLFLFSGNMQWPDVVFVWASHSSPLQTLVGGKKKQHFFLADRSSSWHEILYKHFVTVQKYSINIKIQHWQKKKKKKKERDFSLLSVLFTQK